MCHRTVEARSEPERLDLALMGLCYGARVKSWEQYQPEEQVLVLTLPSIN